MARKEIATKQREYRTQHPQSFSSRSHSPVNEELPRWYEDPEYYEYKKFKEEEKLMEKQKTKRQMLADVMDETFSKHFEKLKPIISSKKDEEKEIKEAKEPKSPYFDDSYEETPQETQPIKRDLFAKHPRRPTQEKIVKADTISYKI